MELLICLNKRRLVALISVAIVVGLLSNFGTVLYLTLLSSASQAANQVSSEPQTQPNKYDLTKVDVNDLTFRTQELLNIRQSVLKELRQLERNRSTVIQQLNEMNNEMEKLKTQLNRKSTELERLQLHIKQAAIAQKEAKDRVDSLIEPPLNLLPKQAQQNSPIEVSQSKSFDQQCQMHHCFDYSRCSLFSPFLIYIYENGHHNQSSSSIYSQFVSNQHITKDANIACVYMLLVMEDFPFISNSDQFQEYLHSLPYWGGDGRNNIIVNLNSLDLTTLGIQFSKAILIQTNFSAATFRHKYDLVMPNFRWLDTVQNTDYWPLYSPARRKYFLTYLGRIDTHSHNLFIKQSLLKLTTSYSSVNHNEFLFDFDCDEKTQRLCANQTIILLDSTFTLVMPSTTSLFDDQLSSKLFDCLSTGTIPVLIGGDLLTLPFEEVIDWSRAVVRIPTARITELYVLLKTFTDGDLFEMKRFGNRLYRDYFSTQDQVINTMLMVLRTSRLNIPPPSAPDEKSQYYYHPNRSNLTNQTDHLLYLSANSQSEDYENLGPLEPPFNSLNYQRNFSLSFTKLYSMWNDGGMSSLYTYPSMPDDPVLPSEAKFIGSPYGFRPIGGGLGGSGREFSEALGGNSIREQFTIVILTYERETVLLDILQKFKNLPYLNKVIVVWNSPRSPSNTIKWADIGVNVVVIRSKKNSLNNRFLPYDEIETDAVLSIDDDTNLRHDEIIFAFRVWREARDRIVGFPARFHAWDRAQSQWLYNSSHTCEFSMILTGAAFFHKYYSYIYTYSMPAAIRDRVDEFMNCEDIAMNFLVSHLTRKPPIKVTSRWTFRCPACQSSLSEDVSHFEKRHKCINHFVSIYGYMPLLYTQFRADSVLFKTRIPHDKQKCFKFI